MLYGQTIPAYNSAEPKPAEHITLSTEISGHAHQYLQVVIGLQGRVEFDVNGIGNRMIPGQGCIVTPESEHAFGGIDKPSDILVLNLTSETQNQYQALQQMYELATSDCYFGLDSNTVQLIKLLAKEIQSSPDDGLLCQACNHTIVALMKKHACPFYNNARSSRLDMDALDRYIAQHLQSKISVMQLAGSVFLSESQFYHQFKKQTGYTPHQYVLIQRVEYAKRLMGSSNASLNHISDMAGFSGQSTFTHAFTKYEGIAPSRYKKQYLS